MTTITIEQASKLKKSQFTNFDQLVNFLLDEGLTSFTEFGLVKKSELSKEAQSMYKEAKAGKEKFIDVTDIN